jgi:hypothetical protein
MMRWQQTLKYFPNSSKFSNPSPKKDKIEDHFDISIPLNNLPTIQTVQELVLEIETLVKA